MAEPSTSPTLLNLARDGNGEAWTRLVQIYGPLVYRWSRGLGLQPSDASDAMQDTMTSVSKDLSRYDPGVGSGKFRGWLWTITRRRIADLQRRQDGAELLGSRAERLVDESLQQPPTDADSDEVGVLHRAVLTFRPRYDSNTWRAFWMTVIDGRNCEDVAKDLGLTRWAVYKARSRILNRLRQDLDGFF
ncbi:ECF RNA polymerase sigma factor SigE [Rubripirellula lacrimiformis]|uniref:ECF RNA polymerase sigma factor SigE n=1 Tax=Rubripirellula lacrimiformis TaxID=1930273 RepID=A0A517ND71_9BACT|nr:sigma-70 family RNA polymerase sigma factor [Rubripirellula lacrimiformis]QDT05079.1 ECF RNA polymerase sigma factor SigE [Rubripirellula lacrimiformis]